MNRRRLLAGASALPLLPILEACAPQTPAPRTSAPPVPAPARAATGAGFRRVRPGEAGWPDEAGWARLDREVGGRLIKVRSPLAGAAAAPDSAETAEVFRNLKNSYYLGDEVGLTQTLGWAEAWVSQPSAYAVAARSAGDVAAAINFARANKLRLVVKGGGHSFLGTSNAKDSLLIWTRPMNAIVVHDAFVGANCGGRTTPQPAVSIGAGAIWASVYDAVTVKAGRYVQGAGCLSVGVAGLVQSGGFGSFSKNYGTAAAALLEAEIVTADGVTRIANACTNPDLFWGIKGGGGGSLGVVTRVTLRTRELPAFFGIANMVIRAASDLAYRRLIGQIVKFYGENLLNPYWGEQLVFRPDNTLAIRMMFQGLNQQQAQEVWRPFLDWLAASPQEFSFLAPHSIAAVPARRLWDADFLRRQPGVVVSDDRPNAPPGNIVFAGDARLAGHFLSTVQSLWLPASLLQANQQARLGDALFAASRHWEMELHLSKGLAGAPAAEIAAARDTATNPAMLEAFALAICAGAEEPAYPGIAGREPDLAAARGRRRAIDALMGELRKLVPVPGSYVAESDYFQQSWQRAYWGSNYPRLLEVKNKYDPEGLFFVHHGVGSERWSPDGFGPMS